MKHHCLIALRAKKSPLPVKTSNGDLIVCRKSVLILLFSLCLFSDG